MAKRSDVAAAATAVVSPSANSDGDGTTEPSRITQQAVAIDPNATGPAAELPGSRRGGTLRVQAQSTPELTAITLRCVETELLSPGRGLPRAPFGEFVRLMPTRGMVTLCHRVKRPASGR